MAKSDPGFALPHRCQPWNRELRYLLIPINYRHFPAAHWSLNFRQWKGAVLVSTADFNTVSRARLESGTAVLDDICRFAIIVDCQRTAFINRCFTASPLAETVCIPPSLIVVSFATPRRFVSPPVSVVPVAVAFVLTISRPPALTCVLAEVVSDSTVNTPPSASRILFAASCSMLNATPSARVPVTRVALVSLQPTRPGYFAVSPLRCLSPAHRECRLH